MYSSRKPAKMRGSKQVRNIVICTVVLIILFLAAGVIYTLIMDQKPAKVTAPVASSASAAVPTHVAPALNAPESAAVQEFTSPVALGSNASINIGTLPKSNCTISVLYNNVASTDSGLTPKVADDYGAVSWSWTIGSAVPVGTWPVKVMCAYHGRTAVVQANIEVTKS
jgi:hypothetical protein